MDKPAAAYNGNDAAAQGPAVTFPRQESGMVRDLEKAMLSHMLSDASIKEPAGSGAAAAQERPPAPQQPQPTARPIASPATAELNALVDDYKMRGSADAAEARLLVQKLQFRMMELEEHVRWAGEQSALRVRDLEEQVEAKNETIDAQRVLLQRYEFAVGEASIFLSRPLHDYQATCEKAGLNLRIVDSAMIDETRIFEEDPTKPRTRVDVDAVKAMPYIGGAPALTPQVQSDGCLALTRFEVRCMQSIRLAYLYTKAVQTIMSQVGSQGLGITKRLPRLNAAGSTEEPVNMANHAKVVPAFPAVPSAEELATRIAGLKYRSGRPLSANGSGDDAGGRRRRHVSAAATSGDARIWNLPAARSRTTTVECGRVGAGGNHGVIAESDLAESALGALRNSSVGSLDPAPVPSVSVVPSVALPSTPNTNSVALPEGPALAEPAGNGRCQKCRHLMLQLDERRDVETKLQQVVAEADRRATNAREIAEKYRIENDMVNAQLEDLTAELFNQANILVADESRLRNALEKQTRGLQLKIVEWKSKTTRREVELRQQLQVTDEARRRMFLAEYAREALLEMLSPRLDETERAALERNPLLHPPASAAGVPSDATVGVVSLYHPRMSAAVHQGSGAEKTRRSPLGITPATGSVAAPLLPVIFVDGVLLGEFHDYLRQLVREASNAPTINHTAAFMRRCLAEDVEPCLFDASTPVEGRTTTLFGPSTGVGAFFRSTAAGGSAQTLRRRVVEAVSKAGCEIQSLNPRAAAQQLPPANVAQALVSLIRDPAGDQPAVEPMQAPEVAAAAAAAAASVSRPEPPKHKCLLCVLVRECDFKLRFLNPMSDWQPCCRFCRDRVVAVCEFYGYLLQLRQAGITPQLAETLQALVGPDGAPRAGSFASPAPALSLFRHVQWLRRRMAAARIGSNGLFDSEALVRTTTNAKCPVVIGSDANASKAGDPQWESWCFTTG